MSAEESRLFPEICKGDIKRHQVFLIIRNNIVSTRLLLSFLIACIRMLASNVV